MESSDSLGFGFQPDTPNGMDVLNPQTTLQGGPNGMDTGAVAAPGGPTAAQTGGVNPAVPPPPAGTGAAQPQPLVSNQDINQGIKTAKETKNCCSRCCGNCMSAQWWQQFFDVDIKSFGKRCGLVFYFWSKKFYTSLGKYGDLWGPIWIPISLIIILVVCAIFGSSISGQTYNMMEIYGYAIGLVVYQTLIPAILYLVIRCNSERYIIRFTQLLCIYGYSQVVYIPIGILLLVPQNIGGNRDAMIAIIVVAWVVLTAFSVLFLTFTLFGTLQKVFFKKEYWIITIVFSVAHVGMALATLFCVILNSRI